MTTITRELTNDEVKRIKDKFLIIGLVFLFGGFIIEQYGLFAFGYCFLLMQDYGTKFIKENFTRDVE